MSESKEKQRAGIKTPKTGDDNGVDCFFLFISMCFSLFKRGNLAP